MAASLKDRGYTEMPMRNCPLALLVLVSACTHASRPVQSVQAVPALIAGQSRIASPPVRNAWHQTLGASDHLRAAAIDFEGDIVWAPNFSQAGEAPPQNHSPGLSLIKTDNHGKTRWIRHLSDNTEAFTMAIQVTGSGRYLVSGSFARTLTIDSETVISKGDRDAFVAMFSATGKLQWLRSLGGLARESATQVAISEDESMVAIAGYSESSFQFAGKRFPARGTASDGFIATFDAEGTALWAQRFRGVGRDRVEGLLFDQGEIAVLGSFSTRLEFSAKSLRSRGGYDIFCVRYDSAGNEIWQHSWGSTKNDYPIAIAILPGGQLALLAQIGPDTIDLGGGALPSRGNSDIVLWTLDSYGNPERSVRIGGIAHESPTSLHAGNTLRIAGSFHGQTNMGFGDHGDADTEANFALELDNSLSAIETHFSEHAGKTIFGPGDASLRIGQKPSSLHYSPQ